MVNSAKPKAQPKAVPAAIKKIPHVAGTSAKVIAFWSPKGGAGKSTLATASAAELARRCEGLVSLADFDRTGNSSNHLIRGLKHSNGIKAKAELVSALIDEPETLMSKLDQMASASQFLILDTPGAVDNLGAQAALAVADLVVIPLSPTWYDLEGTKEGLPLLRIVKARNPSQVQMLVVNKPEKAKVDLQIAESIDGLAIKTKGLLKAKTVIRKSVALRESAVTGLPVWEMGAGGRNPTADISAFCDELLAALGGQDHE